VKLPEGAFDQPLRCRGEGKNGFQMALETEGVAHTVFVRGALTPTQFTNTPNYAIAFVILKTVSTSATSQRQARSADAIQAKLKHNPRKGTAFP